jgi:hypothetical protein
MALETPRFNWLPKTTAWQNLQIWRDKQSYVQSLIDVNSAIVARLSNAQNTQIDGIAKFAAKVALKRVNDAIKAKQDARARSAASDAAVTPKAPTTIALSDGRTVHIDPTMTLAGGSKINLDNGTLKLSDGTLIDLKTGLKKVDVTV